MPFAPSRRRFLAGAVLACFACVTVATSASAYTIQGRTKYVVDGDTIKVDLYGDGTTTPKDIRNAGIQAMETGQCHASAATNAMKALVMPGGAGRVVRLSSSSSTSTSTDSSGKVRQLRFVEYTTATGTTVDVQKKLIEQGHALWYPLAPENGKARSDAYHLAQARASQNFPNGPNLWDSDYCGSGPQQSADIDVVINYDASLVDSQNLNDEYVRIVNRSSAPLNIGGWWVRSFSPDQYKFPSNAVVQPNSYISLRVGKGTNTSTNYYWGFSSPRFQNPTVAPYVGGAAYLYDPQGDVRAFSTYPCVYQCTDPLRGKVDVTVQPRQGAAGANGEYVTIEPAEGDPYVDNLAFHSLERNGDTKMLVGAGTSRLHAGEKIVVRMGAGTDYVSDDGKTFVKYWGRSEPWLPDVGGWVELRNSESVRVACPTWGSGACQATPAAG